MKKILFLAVIAGFVSGGSGFAQSAKKAFLIDDVTGPVVASVPVSIAPDKIAWENYGAISFYLKGMGNGALIAFDVTDAGGEIFRLMVLDDTKDGKQVMCAFDQLVPRGDGQPLSAEKNGVLDFPIKSFQFEPVGVVPGIISINEVALEPLN